MKVLEESPLHVLSPPFLYPVSSSYISSFVIKCHIIVAIFLARATIAFVCPIDVVSVKKIFPC
jgi:hypothetical protein